jgi:excisionase family DNA binding protein
MATQTSVSSRREQAISLRNEGLTYAAIGRKLNVSGEFARQMIKGSNVRLRKKPIPRIVIDAFLTTSQAARVLNVHENTIRRWADVGIIKAYRLGSRGDRRYRIQDVRRLLQI